MAFKLICEGRISGLNFIRLLRFNSFKRREITAKAAAFAIAIIICITSIVIKVADKYFVLLLFSCTNISITTISVISLSFPWSWCLINLRRITFYFTYKKFFLLFCLVYWGTLVQKRRYCIFWTKPRNSCWAFSRGRSIVGTIFFKFLKNSFLLCMKVKHYFSILILL